MACASTRLPESQFLDNLKYNLECFRELVDRLNKEAQDIKLDTYTQKVNTLKQSISGRYRFLVNDIEHLKEHWFVEPGNGEEYSVGILYTMFAHFVTLDSPYSHIWLRPRTFSSMGIDSIAVEIGQNSLSEKVHKTLEYKYRFSPNDEFNHPLILTDQIVCWDMPTGQEGELIKDSYNFYGKIYFTEELDGIGYGIADIVSHEGESYSGKVKVISLKKLLNKTFDCQWADPAPKATAFATGKGRKKSK